MVYVTNERVCFSPCSGSEQDPIDNLWYSFSIETSENIEYVLLKPLIGDHFLINHEKNLPSDEYYIKSQLELNSSLTIRTLDCISDYEVITSFNLSMRCYNQGEKAIVYLKSEKLGIVIRGNLTIKGIILDGSEDLAKYETVLQDSSTFKDCWTSRTLCAGVMNETRFDQLDFGYFNSEGALFTVIAGTLNVSDCSFQNIQFANQSGLFKFSKPLEIFLSSVSFSNYHFKDGIISSFDEFEDWNQSKIKIIDIEISEIEIFSNASQALILCPDSGVESIEITSLSFRDSTIREKMMLIYATNVKFSTLSSISFDRIYNTFGKSFIQIQNTELRVDKMRFLDCNFSETTNFLVFSDSNVTLQDIEFNNFSYYSQEYWELYGFIYLHNSNVQISNFKILNSKIEKLFYLKYISFIKLSFCQTVINFFEFINSTLRAIALITTSDFSMNLSQVILTDGNFSSNVGSPSIIFDIDAALSSCIMNGWMMMNNLFTGIIVINLEANMAASNFMIRNNTIESLNDLLSIFHGGYEYRKTISFTNVTFLENKAIHYSGLIYVFNRILIVTDVVFLRNTFNGYYTFGIQDQNCEILMQKVTVDSNAINDSSGLSYFMSIFYGSFVTIRNSVFVSNQIGVGNLIQITFASLLLQNLTFQSNTINGFDNFQSLIDMQSYSNNTLIDINFIDTYVFNYGNIIKNYANAEIRIYNVNFHNTRVFSSNEEYTALIMISDSYTHIQNLTFDQTHFSNSSKSCLIVLRDAGILEIDNMTVLNSEIGYYSQLIFGWDRNAIIKDFKILNTSIYQAESTWLLEFQKGSLYFSGLEIKDVWFKVMGGILNAQMHEFYLSNLNLTNFKIEDRIGSNLIYLSILKGDISNISIYNLSIRTFEGFQSLFYATNTRENLSFTNLYLNNSKFTDNFTMISIQGIDRVRFQDFRIQNNYFGESTTFFICKSTITSLENFLFENNIFNGTLLKFLPGKGSYLKSFRYYDNKFYKSVIRRFSKIYLEDFEFINSLFVNSILIENLDSSESYLSNILFKDIKISDTFNFINFDSTEVKMNNITLQDSSLNSDAIFIKGTDDSEFIISNFTSINVTKQENFPNKKQKNRNSNYLFDFEFSKVAIYNSSFSQTYLIMSTLSSEVSIFDMRVERLKSFTGYQRILTMNKGSAIVNNVTISNIFTMEFENNRLFEIFDGIFTLANSTLTNFYSPFSVIVFLYGGQVLVTSCSFENMIIRKGYLIQGENFDLLFINNTSFLNCSSPIFAKNSINIILKDVKMEFNNSYQAISTQNIESAQIISSKFLYNIIQSSNEALADSVISFNMISALLELENIEISGAITSFGAVYISYERELKFSHLFNSKIEGNIAKYQGSGGLTILDSSKNTFQIQNSSFLSNKALTNEGGKGGAILLLNDNFASGTLLLINSSIFENNYAERAGGAIFTSYSLPAIDALTNFSSNFAQNTSNHISSNACNIKYFSAGIENFTYHDFTTVPSRIFDPPSMINIAGNIPLSDDNYFALTDCYDQIVSDDNVSILILKISINSTHRNYYYKASQGKFPLSDLTIRKPANTFIYASLSTDGITSSQSITVLSFDFTALSFNTVVNISFRACSIGELYSEIDGCTQCPFGHSHFSLKPDYQETCEICDQNSMNCRGGSDVGPNPRFWRLNRTANLFIKCKNPEACLGAQAENKRLTASTVCASEYQGNLCDECIEGYGRIRSSGTCFECSSSVGGYLVLFATIFLIVCFIMLFYRSMRTHYVISSAKVEEYSVSNQTCVLRIFIHHSQTLTLILSLPIGWPKAIDVLNDVMKSFSLIDIDFLSLDCFYDSISTKTKIEMPYLKLIVANLLPIWLGSFALLSFVFIEKIFNKASLRKILLKLRRNLLLILKFVGFYSIIPIINQDFGVLICENLYRDDTPLYFMQKYYDIVCFDENHLNWTFLLSIPSLIIWMFVLPIISYKKLRSKKNKNDSNFSQKYGLILNGYKEKYYLWESFIFIRSLAVISINYLGSFKNTSLQIYFANYIVIGSYLAQEKLSPYKTKTLNALEQKSLACTTLCSLGGIYFNFIGHQDDFGILITIIIITSNILLIINLGKYFLNKSLYL